MTSRFLFAGTILAAGMAGCTDIGPMADVSVSPDGEIRSPVAALEKVRALRSEGKIPAGRAAVVRFAPGTYFLEKELEVASADAPIDFIGAKGCRTVFSGGRRLEPFKAGADGIWRCKVPEGLVFEQLWVNGRRAQIARHPNKFYNYILASADEDVDPLTGKIANSSRIRRGLPALQDCPRTNLNRPSSMCGGPGTMNSSAPYMSTPRKDMSFSEGLSGATSSSGRNGAPALRSRTAVPRLTLPENGSSTGRRARCCTFRCRARRWRIPAPSHRLLGA